MYALGILDMEGMLALMIAEDVVMHLYFVDSGVINRESAICHSFLLSFDDFLSPFEQVILGRQVGHYMLVRVESVEQFLLFLYLATNDGQVKYLNEMGDIHTCVLHNMTILLIGIHGRGVVVFGLHNGVLEGYEKTLCFAEHLIGQHLLCIIRYLRPLNSILQGV